MRRRHRLASRVTVLVAGALAMLFVGAGPAAAHNVFVASNPPVGGVVAALPSSFSLTFNEPVLDRYLTVVLTPDGAAPIRLDASVEAATVTASLPPGAAQAVSAPEQSRAYRVGYRVISADGHPVSGSYDFSVGTAPASFGSQASGGAAGAPTAAATVEPSAGGSSVVLWASIGGALVVALAGLVVGLRRRRETGHV